MRPRRLENGNLLVPVAFEDPDTGLLADGVAEIGPDHPDYEKWQKWVEKEEEHQRDKYLWKPGDIEISFPERDEGGREDG